VAVKRFYPNSNMVPDVLPQSKPSERSSNDPRLDKHRATYKAQLEAAMRRRGKS
jgi:hypothetical protein